MEARVKKEEKACYEKPVLTKHGKLKDVTALAGSPKSTNPLGCTRLFV